LARPDVICLTNGVFAENCYILADRTTSDAVLVDPGEEVELFLARLQTERLTLRAVWLTHAHVDHVLGIPVLREHVEVPIWLHPDDRPLYDAAPQQARALLGAELEPLPPPDRAFVPGDTVAVGRCGFEVRHVPGHSPGGVALVGEGIALVGDALFAGSIGRTDLPGGNLATLLTSIGQELLTLPDDTIVFAGHGPATTIGRERATNPFLSGAARLV
jgi:hydroxyacylglutathione hydrolase